MGVWIQDVWFQLMMDGCEWMQTHNKLVVNGITRCDVLPSGEKAQLLSDMFLLFRHMNRWKNAKATDDSHRPA